MSYQKSILKKYKATYPKKTLKEISEETGIQMTRVFRIFNGAEMKINEFESFEKSIRKNSTNESRVRLIEKVQLALNTMAERELSYFEIEINHLLKLDQFITKTMLNHTNVPVAL